jgi:hypothetical protein
MELFIGSTNLGNWNKRITIEIARGKKTTLTPEEIALPAGGVTVARWNGARDLTPS